MKKDKKFLNELEANLVGIKDKYKEEILAKYENLIKEEKAQNKKITLILKSIGPAEEVAKKEMEILGDKAKETLFDRLRNNYKERAEKRKIEREAKAKLKEEKEANKRLNDKNIKVSVNNKNVKNDKLKEKEKLEKEKKKLKEKKAKEKEKLQKEKQKEKEEKAKAKEKEKLEKEEKKEESKKDKVTLKERFAKFREQLAEKRKARKERKVTNEPKEVVEEIKEEFNDKIPEVSEIVTEEHIFESKEARRRRIIVRILGVILTTLLLFLWLWVCVLLIASMVAYLDGVKFIGVIIGLFGLSILMLWIVVMVNRSIFRKKMSVTLNLIVIIIAIIMIALGIVLTLKQVKDIEQVKDVSVKYSMVTKLNNYDLPEDKTRPFTVTFNSNYNTQYTINYDDKIKNKVKIEVRYYECYYDYYIKQTSNSAYISLKLDPRDRLSVYIDDLRDGFVFDNDELSRYSVKITINKNDIDRLVIQD